MEKSTLLNLMSMRIKIAFFIAVLVACNPVKRVLNNAEKYNQVKDSVIARGACVNDTLYVFKTGKTDSVFVRVPFVKKVVDSFLLRKAIDSAVNKNDELCLTGLQESYNFGYNDAIDSMRKIKVPVKRPDTLKGYVRDSSLLDLLHRGYKKQLSDSSSKILKLENKLAAAEKDAAVWKEKARKRFWYLFWLIAAVSVVLFRKPLWKGFKSLFVVVRKLIFKR